MNELLKLAIAAHGGMRRWNELKGVKAGVSIAGAIWHLKGEPDALKNVVVEADTQKERLTMLFPDENKRSVFQPEHILIEKDGACPEGRINLISSFAGHESATPWDDFQVAHFSSGALWTYLTTPFLYAYPGFVAEELTPMEESGEQWRRLKITFPDNIGSHTREQISFFGPDGLLRRQDNMLEILNGATVARYASDYRAVDGIIVPGKHRVYAYEGEHGRAQEPLLMAVDLGEIAFH